jgi:thiopeptide-type bacteriocin biosynthesis protein
MAGQRDHGLRADEGIVVRTPLLPLATLLEWAAEPDLAGLRRHLTALIDRPEVNEAIFVASPSLHGAIEKWRTAPDSPAGQRAEHALVKYLARMAGRATPFGLFSAVSAGKLGTETRIALAPRSEYRRRTRIDNDYLFALAAALAKLPEARARLTHRPNTSIYRIAGRIRYAAARLEGKERSYHLVSVEPTPYLDATLARAHGGARLGDLAAALAHDDPDVTADEAAAYLDELVEAQLLIPDLGVFVTGPEPLDGLLDQLAAAGLDEPHAILAAARTAVAAIDAAGLGNAPARYVDVAASLEPLPAKAELSLLFQVDTVKPASATLSVKIAAEVARAIAALRSISNQPTETTLDDFKRAFRERWEDRTVPLADVLDEESGIGFEAATGPGSEGSPLLAGIGFGGGAARPGRVGWGPRETHLLRRLTTALAAGDAEIVLDEPDLEAMKSEAPPRLPDALSAMIQIAGTPGEIARGEPLVLLEGAAGPSGARILGRFCHASPEIDAMVRAHLRAEEALRPAAAFAEIVHLNEGRIGNILCRPVLRDHEIVFLGVSGAPDEAQLQLDDLDVAIRGDRIVLTSRRLGREVVPRNTTAHNFRLRSLGVYRFLCALASQDGDGVGWTWGPLAAAPYLPRVRFGRTVLSRAMWNLTEAELAPITAAVRDKKASTADRRIKVAAAVAALRDGRKLPRLIAIADGDNELPCDLDNPLMLAAFADELAGRTRAQLTELFHPPDRLVAQGPEGGFASELVLTFVRAREPTPALRGLTAPAVQRSFPPGSSWLYAKVYSGQSTIDRVLRDAVAPVVREAIAAGDATHWFFLRYADQGDHLRLRFAGDPARLAGAVLPALDRALAPLLAAGAVRRVQLDTYEREVERYGGDRGIELVEQLFWRDSEAVLEIVELLDGDAGADARWRLALRGIDLLLEDLGLDDAARAKVVTQGRDSLGAEFHADGDFWGRIGERFAKERAALDPVFTRDPDRDAAHDLEPGFAALARRSERLAPIAAELRARDAAGELAPSIVDMAWSLVHMHANRLLHASQRAQELVLHDFLKRLHQARKARRPAP